MPIAATSRNVATAWSWWAVTMAEHPDWMIYRANGYTGHLVAAEARRQGLRPVEAAAAALGLPARVLG